MVDSLDAMLKRLDEYMADEPSCETESEPPKFDRWFVLTEFDH